MIYSIGHMPDEENQKNAEKQFKVFRAHLPLILEHERDILNCADYFFCRLDFAFCSWAWINGSGFLYLGYLLLGWKDCLTGVCTGCGGKVLVTSFGGSVLSGHNGWVGICQSCHRKREGRWASWVDRWHFARNLRRMYPHRSSAWQEHDGQGFTWSGDRLQPKNKKRLIHTPLANPVSLDMLIDELKSGSIRTSQMPNVSLKA